MVVAKYLDGKTSKPQSIHVKLVGSVLHLYTIDSGELPFAKWELRECSSLSFNSSDSLQLGYGERPQQMLELDTHNENIRRELENSSNIEKKTFARVLGGNPIRTVGLGLIVLATLIVVYVMYVSTYVGRAIVNVVPISLEQKLGETALNQMSSLQNFDSANSVLLNEFFDEIGYSSVYDLEIYYDEGNVVNAFALPGGKMVIYKGLIDRMESWEELAALMGHELTHINNRHTLKILSKQLGNYAVFSAITGDMAGISGIILESAINMNEISYSRSFETEADINGLNMLIEHNIRPSAMIDLFERLRVENETVEGILKHLEVLSSHPLTQNRIKYINKFLGDKNLLTYQGKSNRRAQEIWEKLKKSES